MAKVYMAPERTPYTDRHRIFLAGSINMGNATLWQDRVIEELNDLEIDIWNPRRDDWDWTWEQSKDNPKFFEQVNWELMHLNAANTICFFFDKEGMSPITLMELGYMVSAHGEKNIIICCPDGFWRKGNVDIIADRHKVPVVETLEEMISHLRWVATKDD